MSQGGMRGMVHNFPTRKQALAYVKEHKGEGSFAIKLPTGKWFDWSKGKAKRPVPDRIPHAPWYVSPYPTKEGLAIVWNGTLEGKHILECEWPIAEFIVKTINKHYKGE